MQRSSSFSIFAFCRFVLPFWRDVAYAHPPAAGRINPFSLLLTRRAAIGVYYLQVINSFVPFRFTGLFFQRNLPTSPKKRLHHAHIPLTWTPARHFTLQPAAHRRIQHPEHLQDKLYGFYRVFLLALLYHAAPGSVFTRHFTPRICLLLFSDHVAVEESSHYPLVCMYIDSFYRFYYWPYKMKKKNL